MDDIRNAQSLDEREMVNTLDREFARLHLSAQSLVESTPPGLLYALPADVSLRSPGESVLRYAAAIEQTFGGITANLWDDPFEWTLPEHLMTPEKVKEHLNEVEDLRLRAFSSFGDDSCLRKHIATPSGTTQPLIDLLNETLRQANDSQAQAAKTLRILSGIGPRKLII